MSRAAKITLVGSIILSGLTVWGVHYLQEWERDRMYQGVVRDDERRREKLVQRQADYELSKKNREIYERTQRAGGDSTEDSNSGLAESRAPS
ncbi:hypothetical protein K439DRAFT_1325961 [Ramaria rubella]|nr:hypothetical protein K439DRAFT_1325961 [Ramaria rubella]